VAPSRRKMLTTKNSDSKIIFGMFNRPNICNWRAINWVLPRRFESCSPRFYPKGMQLVSCGDGRAVKAID
jgi:hypothetical protein